MKRASIAVVALLMLGVTPASRADAATDTTPPKLWVSPFAPFAVGGSIGPSAEAPPDPVEAYTWDIDERARWKGSDASGICGYDVDVVWAGFAPSRLLTGTLRRSVRTDLGTDYDGTFGGGTGVPRGLRVTAHDCAGNSTTNDIAIRALVTQEDGTFQRPFRPPEATFTYTGRWKTSNYSGFSGGHTAKTYARGASVKIDVVTDVRGEHLALVMAKGPNRGKAAVYVDGTWKKTINTYATEYRHRVIVFDTWLDAGPHTVTVVNKATRGHPRIDIDAVLTHDTVVAPASATWVRDEATFLADNPIVSTERFDTPVEYPPGQHVITIDGVAYDSTDPEDPYWVVGTFLTVPSSQPPEPPMLFRKFSYGIDDRIDIEVTFGPNRMVTAIGFDMSSLPKNRVNFIVEEADGTVTTFTKEPSDADGSYFGFSSSVGIVRLTINETRNEAGTGTNYWIDNVSRSAILDL
jgi:hypothetical protein